MQKEFFYHGTIRKIVIVIGQILSGHQIQRFDEPHDPNNTIVGSLVDVPVKYGKGFYFQKVDQPKDGEPRKRIILPHISYQLLNLMPDTERKTNERNKVLHSKVNARTQDATQWAYSPVPYNIPFIITIRTKTMNDLLQILEQFLVLFDPSLSIQIAPMDKQGKAYNNLTLDLQNENIRVKLEDLDIEDTREESEDGRIECTINIMVLANLYKRVRENPIIIKIINTFRPVDDLDPDKIDFIDGDLTGTEIFIIE